MMHITVEELVAATGGTLAFEEEGLDRRFVDGLAWDSRKVGKGMVFLAMPGERVDGNDYIGAAIGAGAGAVVATCEPSDALKAVAGEFACPIVVVDDGMRALADLAAYWRERLHAIVVGVTGSCGKTSTKDLIASVLAQRYSTVATAANHNNEVGVPATVLSAGLETEALVVEMGMRGLRQIEALCRVVRPGIGVITNIGTSHLELLGTRDNIALAKSELLAALPASGLAVVNADDPYTPTVLEDARVDARHIMRRSYGLEPGAEVHAEDVAFDAEGRASFTLVLASGEKRPVALAMPGRHNVGNALAAAAVGEYLGIMPGDIARGLEEARPSGMRMEVTASPRGVRIVNDAYNANPDSMRASLDTLAGMACKGKRIAALGDMGELGDGEKELHEEVGRHAAKSGLDLLVCVGDLARCIAQGAVGAGMPAEAVVTCPDVAAASEFLATWAAPGDLLLVKASRFMGMERIIKEIA